MSEDKDQFLLIKDENEQLKKQNEELQRQIEVIKQAAIELEKFRKDLEIEKISKEVRNKVLGGFGLIGIASVAGLWGLYTTANTVIKEQLSKSERIEVIVSELAKGNRLAQELSNNKDFNKQVSDTVAKGFIDEFQNNINFQTLVTTVLSKQLPANQNFVEKVTDKVIRDPAFIGRINSTATTTSATVLNQVSQKDPGSDLSAAIDKSLGKDRYFVVAASSSEESDLDDPILKANKQKLKAYKCSAKPPNKRSVVLVTNASSFKDLSFNEAQKIESIVKIKIDPTAYILAKEPASNIFFNLEACK